MPNRVGQSTQVRTSAAPATKTQKNGKLGGKKVESKKTGQPKASQKKNGASKSNKKNNGKSKIQSGKAPDKGRIASPNAKKDSYLSKAKAKWEQLQDVRTLIKDFESKQTELKGVKKHLDQALNPQKSKQQKEHLAAVDDFFDSIRDLGNKAYKDGTCGAKTDFDKFKSELKKVQKQKNATARLNGYKGLIKESMDKNDFLGNQLKNAPLFRQKLSKDFCRMEKSKTFGKDVQRIRTSDSRERGKLDHNTKFQEHKDSAPVKQKVVKKKEVILSRNEDEIKPMARQVNKLKDLKLSVTDNMRVARIRSQAQDFTVAVKVHTMSKEFAAKLRSMGPNTTLRDVRKALTEFNKQLKATVSESEATVLAQKELYGPLNAKLSGNPSDKFSQKKLESMAKLIDGDGNYLSNLESRVAGFAQEHMDKFQGAGQAAWSPDQAGAWEGDGRHQGVGDSQQFFADHQQRINQYQGGDLVAYCAKLVGADLSGMQFNDIQAGNLPQFMESQNASADNALTQIESHLAGKYHPDAIKHARRMDKNVATRQKQSADMAQGKKDGVEVKKQEQKELKRKKKLAAEAVDKKLIRPKAQRRRLLERFLPMSETNVKNARGARGSEQSALFERVEKQRKRHHQILGALRNKFQSLEALDNKLSDMKSQKPTRTELKKMVKKEIDSLKLGRSDLQLLAGDKTYVKQLESRFDEAFKGKGKNLIDELQYILGSTKHPSVMDAEKFFDSVEHDLRVLDANVDDQFNDYWRQISPNDTLTIGQKYDHYEKVLSEPKKNADTLSLKGHVGQQHEVAKKEFTALREEIEDRFEGTAYTKVYTSIKDDGPRLKNDTGM